MTRASLEKKQAAMRMRQSKAPRIVVRKTDSSPRNLLEQLDAFEARERERLGRKRSKAARIRWMPRKDKEHANN